MKLSVIPLSLAALLLPESAFSAGHHGLRSTTISIQVQVSSFAEWNDRNPILFDLDTAAAPTGGQPPVLSKSLVLYANADTQITAIPVLHNGVLSDGSRTLPTAYQLTGPLANPDADFKPSQAFFSPSNSYKLLVRSGTNAGKGAYPITLNVRASDLPNADIVDASHYTCSLILNATW